MKVAFISDLHIKSKDEASDFKLDDKQLSTCLKDILKNCDRLYIVGDMFELWQTKYPTVKSKIREVNQIKKEYPKSMDIVENNKKIILLYGNHDPKNYLSKATHTKLIENDNLLIHHGVYDFLNNKFPRVSEILTWIAGWIERLVYKDFEHVIYNFVKDKLGFRYFKNHVQVKKAKKDIDINDKIKVVVNGHTHKYLILKFKYNEQERIFINSGFFDGIDNNVTYFDTKTFEIVSSKQILEYSDFKEKLQKGDIVLSLNKSNPFAKIIKNLTDGNYSHTMVYLGNNRVIEASVGGIKLATIDKYMEGNHDLLILRLYDRSRMNKFIDELHSELGSRYSYVQLFVDAFYLLINKIFKKDFRKDISIDIDGRAEVCSELIIKSLNSVYNYDYPYATATPQDLVSMDKVFHKITQKKVN